MLSLTAIKWELTFVAISQPFLIYEKNETSFLEIEQLLSRLCSLQILAFS